MNAIDSFKITPISIDPTWQTVVDKIKLGFELQDLECDELSREQLIKYNDCIILAPDYQREYRSSLADESSLIESALIGIPIPPVFVASHKIKGVQALNVVDGQHRLRAFYRFFTSKFKLSELKILTDFNGKSFDELEIDDVSSLQSRTITQITFRDFPGKDFELEIFNRYNKGTKPLTPQEIRHAVYNSKVNEFVNDFCKDLNENVCSPLSNAYGFSKDRYLKKTIHESIFVILSILELGIDQKYKNEDGVEKNSSKSPEFAENYMKMKSELEKNNENNQEFLEDSYIKTKELLFGFNEFIYRLCSVCELPFSREIYGVAKKGNKFQVSISMILAAIYRKLMLMGFDFNELENQEHLVVFHQKLMNLLANSYLEDPEYKASTTNPYEIRKLVDSF